MLLPIYFPTLTCCLCFSPSRAQHFRLFLMKFLSNIQESFPWAVGIISYSDCGLLSLAASRNCGLVYLFFSFKKYIFNKMEYKTSCWITYLKYPSWQWSSTSCCYRAIFQLAMHLPYCNYIYTILLSLSYMSQSVTKIKHCCICCFLFIHQTSYCDKEGNEIDLTSIVLDKPMFSFFVFLFFFSPITISAGYLWIDCLMISSWIF